MGYVTQEAELGDQEARKPGGNREMRKSKKKILKI